VYQQAENRLHAQKAILLELMQYREAAEPLRQASLVQTEHR
jgi:hypothetical protein